MMNEDRKFGKNLGKCDDGGGANHDDELTGYMDIWIIDTGMSNAIDHGGESPSVVVFRIELKVLFDCVDVWLHWFVHLPVIATENDDHYHSSFKSNRMEWNKMK